MRIGALVSTVTAVCLVFLDGPGDKAYEKESPAVNAARLRQNAVTTLEIRFRRTDEYALRPTASPSAKALYADADLSPVESVNRLVLSGDMIRYEDNHPGRLMPSGRLQPKSMIRVYDGAIGKSLFPSGLGGEGEPQGFIESKNPLEDFMHIALRPIHLTFRGLHPVPCTNSVFEWQSTDATATIDGVVCHEFTLPTQSTRNESFWLAPDQDYVVRRIRLTGKNGFSGQTDIHYRRHETYGWVPDSWVISGYSGTLTYAVTIKIDMLEMRFNHPNSAEQFQIEFPAGCLVFDHDANKFYRVLADKSLREIDPGADRLPTPVATPSESWYQRSGGFLVAWAIVCIVTVLLYFLRRKVSRAA
jgi:hypothetical protein